MPRNRKQRSKTGLIIEADRLARKTIGIVAQSVFPGERIVLAGSFREAMAARRGQSCALVMTGAEMPDGDVLDFLPRLQIAAKSLRCVLVITRCKAYHLLTSLREAEIGGVFDSETEDTDSLRSALISVRAMIT